VQEAKETLSVAGWRRQIGFHAGEEAFRAALHATDQSGAQGKSTWDRELAAAAHSLLAEWKDELDM